ncbi:kinesin-like protein subito [Contarinia nasturtii]|uniref:kinesin-like protein subito n=1 Tax=Contarinia nasturtii TaxID=265458 RepID=UPI0012D4639F|nr:kinesin-like protein subito [Contarinia nasturtii]
MIGRVHFVRWMHQPKSMHIRSAIHYSSDATSNTTNNTDNFLKYDSDPSKQFLQKTNRELMYSLTTLQIDRVFATQPKPFERPTYHFYSAEEVKNKLSGALRQAKRLLAIPPILPIEEDNIQVLAKDPEVQGYTKAKFVFCDTTFGLKDRDRTVMIRHPTGVLETADQLTKRRVIETYFPFNGRRIITPRMFFGEHLQRLLNEGKYLFVLNRATVQFEPFEKDYHRVTSLTYQHINKQKAFDSLRSTRHFGAMAFFLAWHKLIDNLVIDCIERDYLRNAVEAICLMYNINKIPYDVYILDQLKRYPKRDHEYFYSKIIDSKEHDIDFEIEKVAGKNEDDLKCDEICLNFLDEYCKSSNVTKTNEIKATIQTYRELAEEKRRLLQGLQKAHGINYSFKAQIIMADDRVSYLYQRDASIDRMYRPRPKNCTRNLYKEIEEDEEIENLMPNGNSVINSTSSNSSDTDTVDTQASVFLRLCPVKLPSVQYEAENNLLKVLPVKLAATNNKDLTEKHFEFSKIFHNDATQLDIYNQLVQSSIQNNESLTVLTYGTSGSGKTYTMYGTETDAGIVQRALTQIFTNNKNIICPTAAAKLENGNISMVSEPNANAELELKRKFIRKNTMAKNQQIIENIRIEHGFEPIQNQWQHCFVWISFAEIYNENVYDLLRLDATKRENLKIIGNDGNSFIKDLTSVYVVTPSEAIDVINAGLQQVNYASTNINKKSSRSHCILILNVIHFSYPDRFSNSIYKFCDLAGSERLKKTENVGERLKEAQRINTSLMVLGRCYDLMYQNQNSKSKEVLPFRESKLTMLLQKSLLGHEKITTIVTMAPKLDFMEENLHVLNFASIAQQIVFKQPKQEVSNKRAARSTRFSWFMPSYSNEDGYRDDINDLIKENERLEDELFDLKDKMEQIVQEYSHREQEVRKQLVAEREEQVNREKEKANRHKAFIESKSKEKIDQLERTNAKLQQRLDELKGSNKELKRKNKELKRIVCQQQQSASYNHLDSEDDEDSDDEDSDDGEDSANDSSDVAVVDDLDSSVEKRRRLD